MPKPIALITGATSGIGQATAHLLIKQGYRLIVTGRRMERLETMAADLNAGVQDCLTACFDVRDAQACENFVKGLPTEWKDIDVLVNNAGLAMGLSKFYDGSLDHWNTMLDTNVKGLLHMSKAVAQGMRERAKGDIINIGSIAGKQVYDNGNVYCASKHAVDALTQAMRLELAPAGIRVCGIHPGAVETEFSLVRFEGDVQRANSVYDGFENLVAQDIAEAIAWVLSRPPHVNINDLVIMPQAQPQASVIHRKS